MSGDKATSGMGPDPQGLQIDASRGPVGKIRQYIEKHGVSGFAPLAVLVVLVVVFSIVEPTFLSGRNLQAMGDQMSGLMLLALGVTFVVLMGSIDISFAALAGMISVCMALLVPTLGYFALVVSLFIGLAAGLLNGLLLTKVKLPSIIVTLGTSGVFGGLAYILSSGGHPVDPGNTGPYYWMTGFVGGFPMMLIIALVFFFALLFVQNKTWFGRAVFAIGAGERVATLTGIRVSRIKTGAWVLAGFCTAVGAFLLSSKMAVGSPLVSDTYLLNGLAGVFVGGTACSGGTGGVQRTIVGCALVTALNNAMNILEVNVYLQQAFVGLILLVAVVATFDRRVAPIVK